MNYAVFLEGENFEIDVDGKMQLLGFFTTVRVDAHSPEEAKSNALKVLLADPQLERCFANQQHIKPTIEAQVVHELLGDNHMKNTGYTFFPMETADEG